MRGTVGYEDGNESGLSICHADHLAVRLALKNAAYGDTKWYAVYAHADGSGATDAWTRLDGDVYTWVTEKVASHGGWKDETTR